MPTVVRFREVLRTARTVVWNGPMGVFEMPPFRQGTVEIARAVAACTGTTVVGGGDTIAALALTDCSQAMTHISTGGGASLEFLEGQSLPVAPQRTLGYGPYHDASTDYYRQLETAQNHRRSQTIRCCPGAAVPCSWLLSMW